MSSILVVSFAAAVILVVGGGLMVYMGNLVRSAYELKVQITADLDERLVKIAEENDKKSRWIKRDVLEEVEKMRVAIVADHTRRFQELAEPLVIRLEELEVMLRNERTEWVKAVESDRQNITALDTRVRALRRDLRRAMEKMGIESSLALDEAMSNLSAPNPASNQPAPPAAEVPPASEAQPVLPDLTQSR